MINLIKRAFRDTFSGKVGTAILALIGASISIGVLWGWKGKSVVFEELPYIATGFLGAIGSVVMLFFFNLACAPYRIERDAHLETKDQLSKLSSAQPKPPSASLQLGNDLISVAEKVKLWIDSEKPERTLPHSALPFFGELTSVTIRLNAMGMPTPTDKEFYDRYGIDGRGIYFPKIYTQFCSLGQLLIANETELAIEHANEFTKAFKENSERSFHNKPHIIKQQP